MICKDYYSSLKELCDEYDSKDKSFDRNLLLQYNGEDFEMKADLKHKRVLISGDMKKIPFIDGIKELDCSDCIYLEEIPSIQTLKSLNCDGCMELLNIPNIKKLECLSCNGSSISSIPPFETIKVLICKETDVSDLSFLNNLEDLNCQNCSLLLKLPVSDKMQDLNCSGCILLNELPDCYKKLKILECEYCIFKFLPKYDSLEELYCSDCSFLLEIPNYQQLRILQCANCIFKSLPEIDSLEELLCEGCRFLLEIPNYQNMKELSCVDCLSLRFLPDLPSSVEIGFRECPFLTINRNDYYVNKHNNIVNKNINNLCLLQRRVKNKIYNPRKDFIRGVLLNESILYDVLINLVLNYYYV